MACKGVYVFVYNPIKVKATGTDNQLAQFVVLRCLRPIRHHGACVSGLLCVRGQSELLQV